MITSRQAKYLVWGLFLLTTLLVVYRKLVYFPDSDGYLQSYLIRTAGYPLFLKAVSAVSGDYFEWVLKALQALMGCWGIGYFLKTLTRIKVLKPAWAVLLCAILLTPYLFDIKIGNKVLSEALAYPLFLVVSSHLFKALIRKSSRDLLIAVPWLFLLLTVRGQFLFMVPIGLGLAYLIFRKDRQVRPFLIGLGLWIALPIANNLADKAYHAMEHGHFVSTPWKGIHFLAPAMFVAEEEDIDLFSDPTQREYFRQMHLSLANKKLHIDHPNPFHWDPVVIYVYEFAEIANSTLFSEGKDILAPGMDRYATFIEVDRQTSEMAGVLVRDNFKRWFRIYRGNFVHGMGNSAITLALLILLLYGVFRLFRGSGKNMESATLALLLLFGNMGIVSIGMHTINRFIFYNQWVVIFLLILWLQPRLSKK